MNNTLISICFGKTILLTERGKRLEDRGSEVMALIPMVDEGLNEVAVGMERWGKI